MVGGARFTFFTHLRAWHEAKFHELKHPSFDSVLPLYIRKNRKTIDFLPVCDPFTLFKPEKTITIQFANVMRNFSIRNVEAQSGIY